MGQQVPTEAIFFAQQHAEQTQAQAPAQATALMTEIRQDSLMQPRAKHRSEFAPLANVTCIIANATRRNPNENTDSDVPPKRGGGGEEGLQFDRRNLINCPRIQLLLTPLFELLHQG